MSSGQSNEHLRNYKVTDPDAKKYGYYDPTRVRLNFEVGKGGVIMPVRKNYSIVQRFKDNLRNRGIEDPNEIKKKNGKEPNRNTIANIILGGSREQMHRLAYGDQKVNLTRDSDNSQIQRKEDIEKWAVDMYNYVAKRFGEENIVAFIVHLDEKNPHVHCTIVPVNEKNKVSYRDIFGDRKKAKEVVKQLHNEVADVNKKWGLDRGEDINTTGAKHRTSEEYWRELRDTSTVLENKNSNLQKDIRRAEIKIKGLSQMLSNLETQREDLIKELGELSEQETSKREAIEKAIEELDDKIQDKQDKLMEATEQYSYLKALNESLEKENFNLQKENDRLKRSIESDLKPTQESLARNKLENALNWYQTNLFRDFYNRNPDLQEILEQNPLYDLAANGEHITKAASMIMVGRIDDAVSYTLAHGGGGGSNNALKRDDKDDDFSWMIKCLVSAGKMMKGKGRKQKR